MTYLVVAYGLIWLLVFLYVLLLGGQQKRLAQQIKLLAQELSEKE